MKKVLDVLLSLAMILSVSTSHVMAKEDRVDEEGVKYIASSEELVEAIKNQKDGETWIFTEAGRYDVATPSSDNNNGGYDLPEKEEMPYPDGQMANHVGPYVFPIYADGLTIKKADGIGEVVLTSSALPTLNDTVEINGGGNWNWQSFMIISASNVVIQDVTLLGNRNLFNVNGNAGGLIGTQCDKIIETVDQAGDLTLNNVVIDPLTVEGETGEYAQYNGTQRSGSLYFNHAYDANKTVKLTNVYTHGGIKSANNVNIELNGVVSDFKNNTYSEYNAGTANYAWNPGIRGGSVGVLSNARVVGNGFTIVIDENVDFRQIFNESLLQGMTIQFAEGTYDSAIAINKSIQLVSEEDAVLNAKITINEPNIDVAIDGLHFIGNGSIESTSNNENTNISILNCTANDLNQTFVYTNGNKDKPLGKITVHNNTVKNIEGVNQSAFNLWNASEHELTNNVVDTIDYHAFNLNETIGNVVFEGNQISNTGKGGLQLANTATGDVITIKDNVFTNVANRPYWEDKEENGLNYAAIRAYGSNENAFTADLLIEGNTFVNCPVAIWGTNRKTTDGVKNVYPIQMELQKNRFMFQEESIYGVYVDTSNTIDLSKNYWGQESLNLTGMNMGNVSIYDYYIDYACTELGIVDKDLNAYVNNTELKNLVDSYQGLTAEDYTEASWEKFADELAKANAVILNLRATKAEITNSIASLKAAYQALVKAVIEDVEVEIPVIENPKDVEEVVVGVSEEENTKLNDAVVEIVNEILETGTTTAVSEEVKEAILAAVENGETISVSVEINDQYQASEAEVALITSVLKENEAIAQYFDLSLFLRAGGRVLGEISTFTNEIAFQIALPEDMLSSTREYFILCMQDGKVEKIPATLEGNVLTFKTAKFTTYAVGYTETATDDKTEGNVAEGQKDPESVNTGDYSNPYGYLFLSLAAFAVCGMMVLSNKRRKSYKG